MFFLYSDSFISNNTFHQTENFFWTNFISLVPELYILRCFLYNQAIVIKFSYKTINIAYFLGNIHKYDFIEIFRMRFWFDVIK